MDAGLVAAYSIPACIRSLQSIAPRGVSPFSVFPSIRYAPYTWRNGNASVDY
jgi:hypothetical protein